MNFNWKNVLNQVCQDIESFVENGCWGFLHDNDQNDEESEEESGSEVAFNEEELKEADEDDDDHYEYSAESEFQVEELSDEGIPLDELGKSLCESDDFSEDEKRVNKRLKRR